MSTEQKPLFSLAKVLPITVFVTILSQTSVIFYYNCFNFSPIPYFEPYELIMASVKDFCMIVIVVILYSQFCLLYLIYKKRNSDDWSTLSFKEKVRNVLNTSRRSMGVGLFFFISALFISYLGLQPSIMRLFTVIFLGITVIMVSVSNNSMFLVRSNMKSIDSMRLKRYYPSIDTLVVMAVGILIWAVLTFSVLRHEYIVSQNPYLGSELTLEKEIVRCTSKVIVIGKSQKYYFIYNSPDKSVRIIKRDNIKKEVIKVKGDANILFIF